MVVELLMVEVVVLQRLFRPNGFNNLEEEVLNEEVEKETMIDC